MYLVQFKRKYVLIVYPNLEQNTSEKKLCESNGKRNKIVGKNMMKIDLKQTI